MNPTHNKLPLNRYVRKKYFGEACKNTYVNQRIAELPSAFLVSSHPSSSAMGSRVIEPVPIRVMITKRPAPVIQQL
jgi:hypothetical protein